MSINIFTAGTDAKASEVNTNFYGLLVGDGSDGAFSQSSGSTSLTQGTVYQYTSFGLTGTATLTTTKTSGAPIVILVQGNLTISSNGTCDFSGRGIDSPTSNTNSITATALGAGLTVSTTFTNFNNGGNGRSDGTYGDAIGVRGNGGNPPTLNQIKTLYNNIGIFNHTPNICSGTKGGDGSNNGGSGGAIGTGSSGGASIIFIVGGTATISNITFNMNGTAGGNATVGTGNGVWQGGGGGGGGSIAIFSYGALTDTGTYTVAGGAGGTGAKVGTGSTNFAGSGGGGASCIASGGNGDGSKTAGVTGGAGADGVAIRKQIKW